MLYGSVGTDAIEKTGEYIAWRTRIEIASQNSSRCTSSLDRWPVRSRQDKSSRHCSDALKRITAMIRGERWRKEADESSKRVGVDVVRSC